MFSKKFVNRLGLILSAHLSAKTALCRLLASLSFLEKFLKVAKPIYSCKIAQKNGDNKMKKPRILWAIRPTVRAHGTQKGYNRAKEKSSRIKSHL